MRHSGRREGKRARRYWRASKQKGLRSGAGFGDRLALELLEPRLVLSPLISEFLASNKNGLVDSFGEASDWIEVCNPDSRASVDLTNWKLKLDNAAWTFPAVTLGPNEYRVVFASERNLTDPNGELHTNFNLGKTGDSLYLIDPSGNTVQSWTPYPAQQADVSYGVGQAATRGSITSYANQEHGGSATLDRCN